MDKQLIEVHCSDGVVSATELEDHYHFFSPSTNTMDTRMELDYPIDVLVELLECHAKPTIVQEAHINLYDYLQPKEGSTVHHHFRCAPADFVMMKRIGKLLPPQVNRFSIFVDDEDIKRYVLVAMMDNMYHTIPSVLPSVSFYFQLWNDCVLTWLREGKCAVEDIIDGVTPVMKKGGSLMPTRIYQADSELVDIVRKRLVYNAIRFPMQSRQLTDAIVGVGDEWCLLYNLEINNSSSLPSCRLRTSVLERIRTHRRRYDSSSSSSSSSDCCCDSD